MADFLASGIWSLGFDDSNPSAFNGTNYTDLIDHTNDPNFIPDGGAIGTVSSFGEDAAGNLYVLDLVDGEIFLVPEPAGWSMQVVALLTTFASASGILRCRAKAVS